MNTDQKIKKLTWNYFLSQKIHKIIWTLVIVFATTLLPYKVGHLLFQHSTHTSFFDIYFDWLLGCGIAIIISFIIVGLFTWLDSNWKKAERRAKIKVAMEVLNEN